MEGRTAALIADGIHKSFGNVEVLKGVSLTAREGDVIAMVGASGSGKSTFLRCVNFLETPDAGSITVGGETIRIKAGAAPSKPRPMARSRPGAPPACRPCSCSGASCCRAPSAERCRPMATR